MQYILCGIYYMFHILCYHRISKIFHISSFFKNLSTIYLFLNSISIKPNCRMA